jgi:Fe2+ transport system protein FeoA
VNSRPDASLPLAELALGTVASVTEVTGSGSFRRRLLELGILPGTRVEVVGVAPLGDPIELLVRGSSLSIRRSDAASVSVLPITSQVAPARAESAVFGSEALRRGPR